MKGTAFLVALLLLALATAGWAASSDPNDWATADVSGPLVGSPQGTYTSTWGVSPTADWPTEWLLIGVEFHPDGNAPSNLSSSVVPSGWNTDLYNPSDGWLAWYANGSGQQSGMTNANGLTAAQAGSATWTGAYTTTGAINTLNYHLVFVNSLGGPNPNGQWQIEQSSLTADPVPEPATLALLGTGLAGLMVSFKRRRRA